MRETCSVRAAAALRFAAAFVSLLLVLPVLTSAAPATAQDTGGYGVACADAGYFAKATRGSPVETYVRIDDRRAARAFLRQATGGAPASGVDAVLVLHVPDGGARVGVVPFADGCALDAGFLSPKLAVDQVLAGLLHDGLIE